MKCIKVFSRMKYIRRFNEELNIRTYRSASDKLKEIGHINRHNRLKEWSDKVELDNEERNRNKVLNRLKEVGYFKMNYLSKDKIVMTGNFYIDIGGLDADNFVYNYLDNCNDDGVFNWNFFINLDLGFIPADEETKNDFYKIEQLSKWDFYSGVYWNMDISISIINDGEKEINPSGVYFFFNRGDDGFKFYNRAEAVKFRRLLSDSFLGKNDWGYNGCIKDSTLLAFSDPKLPKDIFNEESYNL